MALELRLDEKVVFMTEDAKSMREEVAMSAYGVGKARTAETLTVVENQTGEVVYSYNCDDHEFTSSAWVQRFIEAFEGRM